MNAGGRFWASVSLFVAANFVVLAAVLVRGDQRPAAGNRPPEPNVRTVVRERPARLVLQRVQDSVTGVWLLDIADYHVRLLSPPGDDAAVVSVSPRGDEIAYAAPAGMSDWNMWAITADGTSRRLIQVGKDGRIARMAWSPLGDVIAFEENQVFASAVSKPRVWLVRSDGSDRALVYGRGSEFGARPAWAPDGRQLAFYDEAQHAYAVFNFTTHLQAFPTQINDDATWSPDGRALAFTDRGNADSPPGVVLTAVGLQDGVARRIDDAAAIDSTPAWSPTGEWIAFVRLIGTTSGVWLIHPDGTGLYPLQQEVGWSYSTPVWAADGSELAFSRHPTRVGPLDAEPEVWLAPIGIKPRKLDVGGKPVAWIP